MSEAELRTELDAVRASLKDALQDIDNLQHEIQRLTRESIAGGYYRPHWPASSTTTVQEPTDAPF